MLNLFDAVLPGFMGKTQQDDSLGGIPYWVILLVALLVILAGIIWFLVNEDKEKSAEKAGQPPVKETEPDVVEAPAVVEATVVEEVAEEVEVVEEAEPVVPDDLKLIEGIGPKISGVLQAAGINTFAQLATTDAAQLTEILQAAGVTRLANPATWSEQAQLAADGNMDALKELQDSLKGGRRS